MKTVYISDEDLVNSQDFYNRISDLAKVEMLSLHDAEIRKPLEDEIERLKNRIEILYNAQTIITKNYEEQIPVFEQQSRQKVIAELEEWCDINEQFGVHNEKFIKDLRQKLNEMKGEKQYD